MINGKHITRPLLFFEALNDYIISFEFLFVPGFFTLALSGRIRCHHLNRRSLLQALLVYLLGFFLQPVFVLIM